MTRRRRIVVALVALSGVAFAAVSFVAYRFVARDGAGQPYFQLNEAPRFTWRSVDKKHWQAVTTDSVEAPDTTDEREGTRGACSVGMVEIAGASLLDSAGHASSDEIEALQNKTCSNWLNTDFPARCQTFDRDGWLKATSELPRERMHYCIDRFEYPNVRGENPIIVVTYNEASSMCRADSKRLCTETEWTFACEGEEGTPYPNAYERDADACVIDRAWRPFAEGALQPRDGPIARAELDRLWQGEPSGSRPKCRSALGVYDMTGNVDEWTRSVRSEGYASVLKGGYWGPVRARCRPSTRAHNEQFVAYQQGFRCCTDAPDVAVSLRDGGGVALASDPGIAASSPRAMDAGDVPDGSLVVDAHVHALDHASDRAQDHAKTGTPSVVPVEYSDEAESLAKRVGASCDVSAAIGSREDARFVSGAFVVVLAVLRARRRREVRAARATRV